MEELGFNYEDEELNEIDYFELVSLDEIIKLNPVFVAFSQEELYDNFYNFFKNKTKAEGFLKLFNEIIERQKNPYNINNYIIITDAKRDNFQDLDIEDFVTKIKANNKEQIQFALKNKNKLWFPLVYNIENSINFSPSSISVLELNKNDNYIIFKDDEREIPVLAVYYYEPSSTNNTNLNEKIVDFLNKDRYKGEILEKGDYKSFEDMIKNYKIKLPLDKIDIDEFHYSSINDLFSKFNYNLDYMDNENYQILKNHLEELVKKEKEAKFDYKKLKIEPFDLSNNRYLFYLFANSFIKLLNITRKSSIDISNKIKIFTKEKEVVSPIINDLEKLVLNINQGNYDEIINNLKNIRKNLSIDNYISLFENKIDEKITNIINIFEILTKSYKDIFTISFQFQEEEHEIKIGLDTKDYEGIPLRIDDFKKNVIFIDEENDDEIEEVDIIDDNTFFKKYYHNSRYNFEKGFIDVLKKICPSLKKMMELSKLPLNFDIIIENLFKNYSGKVHEKTVFIKNNYNGKFDDEYYKKQATKTEKFVLNMEDEDTELINAYTEYTSIIIDMIFDVICKWSIEIQNEILNGTLMFDRSRCYIPCINDVWFDYGMPYNMDIKEKDGVLPYLICICDEVFKEDFSETDDNYLPYPNDMKKKIIQKIITNYSIDLKKFENGEKKKKKDTRGLEAQKQLIQYYDDKKNPQKYREYKNKSDKFFDNFIEALIYMPSVRYEKVHKYLLGCCLEKIDENFSVDTFLKSNRKDLEKAKGVFASERVLNKKRYERFYLIKKDFIEKKDDFDGIKYLNNETYFIYESNIDEWFTNMSDKTIINKKHKEEIQTKLRDIYNLHMNMKDFKKIPSDYNFNNYRQILTIISTILYKNLKNDALEIIKEINETIKELDNLSSIINDDNNTYIYQIRAIFVLRAMCLPSYPDINKNPKFIPKIKIEAEVFKKISNEIMNKILKIIMDNKMPTLEDQINYINKIREENKDKILSNLNKKTREEREIINEMKKIGLKIDDVADDDIKDVVQNKPDDNAEGDFDVMQDDEEDKIEEDLDNSNYGFLYGRYNSRDYYDN
jgi:hypothetical protein